MELTTEARIKPMARNPTMAMVMKIRMELIDWGQGMPYNKCANVKMRITFGMYRIQPVITEAKSKGAGVMGVTL